MFATDTHPMAYYAGSKPSKLSRRAWRLFEDASQAKTVIYVPTPALWEIHRLIKADRVELTRRFDHWCRDLDSEAGFIIEPLTWHDVDEARRLPFPDPFDCLIAGTALRLGIPLITKDQGIVDSGLVETIW
jgi:PIN domain nuclease of toxin-antitoxin system